MPAPDLDLPVVDALYSCERAVTFEAEGLELGTSMTAKQVLYARHFADSVYGMPMSELARRTGTTMANISAIASRMERWGLVTREPSPTDGRSRLISLTARGYAEFEVLSRRWAAYERRLSLGCMRGMPAQLISDLEGIGAASPWRHASTSRR